MEPEKAEEAGLGQANLMKGSENLGEVEGLLIPSDHRHHVV